jgi:outer membrane protein OmpA-like peptidoglycan-associated protein
VEQAEPEKPDLTKIEKQEVIEPEVEPVVETPKPVILVLKTIDKETKGILNTDVTITNTENSRSVPVRRIGNGMYQAQFMDETASNYNITIQKSGYMYKNVAISVPAMSTRNNKIARQVMLDKIKVGYSQVIRNIYFDFGTARLQSASDVELNKLLRVIEDNPQYLIEISGHTDSVGPDDFNQWLSKRRAQAVVNYMVNNGQRDASFLAEGYGEDRPLASNDDEDLGRELNRRVEFKVLKFKQ